MIQQKITAIFFSKKIQKYFCHGQNFFFEKYLIFLTKVLQSLDRMLHWSFFAFCLLFKLDNKNDFNSYVVQILIIMSTWLIDEELMIGLISDNLSVL